MNPETALIPDSASFRRFTPNIFEDVMGMPSMFEKIEPFVNSAQSWFEANFIPPYILQDIIKDALSQDEPLYFLPRRIVAVKAWISAIPSVDVVVTQNGLGVVQTNTIAPASTQKIDRLLSTLRDDLDSNLALLIPRLRKIPHWVGSRQAAEFGASLFPDFSILRSLGIHSDLWHSYLRVRQSLSLIEDEIADKWISHPLLARLRHASLVGQHSPHIDFLLTKVRAAVRRIYAGKESPVPGHVTSDFKTIPELDEAVQFIRENVSIFPEWDRSPQARLFNAKPFSNSQSSTAYFF